MKLKGLLKGLCIFGLTLLPISFASSYYDNVYVYEPLEPFYCYNGSSKSVPAYVDANLNFHSVVNDSDYNGFTYYFKGTTDSWNFGIWGTYGWSSITGGIQVVGSNERYNEYINRISNSFFMCDFNINDAVSSITNCFNRGTIVSFDSFKTIFSNNSFDYFVIDDRCYEFCFYSSGYSKAFCQYMPSNNSNSIGLFTLTGDSSVQFSNISDFISAHPNFFANSPFYKKYDNILDSDVIYIDFVTGTNKEYFDAFESRGYYKGLCYSDFYTGNLVDSNTEIYELFQGDLDDSVYTGHSVFDFYASENSSVSIYSWAMQRYNLMKYTYERDSISPFIGYEKGTWSIMFDIYNNHFNDNFSWIDYFSYCNMVVYGFNPNESFSGDVSSSMDDYVNRLESNDNFVLSGVDFSGSVSLLSLFNELYSRARVVFLLDEKNSSIVGILPTYIIFGFFLFLLLYGLRR